MAKRPTSAATGLGFGGFGPAAFAFLRDLAENNSKAWFDEHRETYRTALRQPLCRLVEALALACEAEGLPLTGSAKTSLFRINRDVRFSHNKQPYNSHVSAALTRSGSRKDISGCLYLHLEPENCFTAAGFFQPEMKNLTALREDIVEDPKTILGAVAALAQSGYSLEQGDSLKRLPRGFEPTGDEQLDQLLRLKSYIVVQTLPEGLFGDGPALVAQLSAFACQTRPLLAFGNAALDLREANAQAPA